MVKKKLQHGGKRKGSGRRLGPEGRTVTLTVSVPESLFSRLDAYVEAREGQNRSKAVTEAIRGLLARKKSRS